MKICIFQVGKIQKIGYYTSLKLFHINNFLFENFPNNLIFKFTIFFNFSKFHPHLPNPHLHSKFPHFPIKHSHTISSLKYLHNHHHTSPHLTTPHPFHTTSPAFTETPTRPHSHPSISHQIPICHERIPFSV